MTGATPLEEASRLWVAELAGRGISASVTGRLANGLRGEVRRGESTCRVNLYFSRAKGFSVVYAGGDRRLAVEAALAPGVRDDSRSGYSVGMDEAGKGDYYGPLVAAAVCLGPGQAARLRREGVADSKTLGDRRISELAASIRENVTGFSVAVLVPYEYNNTLDSIRSRGLNSLDMLAGLHGRALGKLLETCPAPDSILLDKFCSEKRLSKYMPAGAAVEMRTGAETDTAVAAASILARCEYFRQLCEIRTEYGIEFPAGSAAAADRAGRELVGLRGPGSLQFVAKYHFRNTQRILG